MYPGGGGGGGGICLLHSQCGMDGVKGGVSMQLPASSLLLLYGSAIPGSPSFHWHLCIQPADSGGVNVLVAQPSQHFATPWTVARQAPLSMEFSRQEYWSGLPFPPPGDLLDPGSKHGSPPVQVDSLPCEPPGKPYLRLTRPVFPNRDQLDD